MKRAFYILLFCSLLIMSCEKTKYESSGTINGIDMTMCACCGGYLIDIEGTRYRFEKSELPSGFTFNDNQIPLQVELNWELKSASCTSYNWIKILKIRTKE